MGDCPKHEWKDWACYGPTARVCVHCGLVSLDTRENGLNDVPGRFVQPEGTQPLQRQIEMLEAALQEIIDIASKNSLRCSVCNEVLDIALLTLADVAETREADGKA